MSKIICDVSISLDGFMAGPNDSIEIPLGEGGNRLHQWPHSHERRRSSHNLEGRLTNNADDEVMTQGAQNLGAVVVGRRMFDGGEKPWGDNPPFTQPVFVVTHRPRPQIVKQNGVTFTFVTDGLEAALEQARAVAGDKDIAVGGANIIQQCLKAGILDEIKVHIVPVLFGQGLRLFDQMDARQIELTNGRVIAAPDVTHFRFKVQK